MNTVLVHYIVAATCIIHHYYSYTRIFVVDASTCDNMPVVEYVLAIRATRKYLTVTIIK